jgi:hypothetical protein
MSERNHTPFVIILIPFVLTVGDGASLAAACNLIGRS